MHASRAVAVAACLSVLLAACSDKPATETDAPASTLAVTLAPAQMRPIQRTVVVSGPVAPFEEMQLGVEISGARVTALNADVGQQVRKGEVLLELDQCSFDRELQQARAALAEAEAGVQLARANLTRGELLVKDKYISASQLDELRGADVLVQIGRAHV